jgi:hypothetical protein
MDDQTIELLGGVCTVLIVVGVVALVYEIIRRAVKAGVAGARNDKRA